MEAISNNQAYTPPLGVSPFVASTHFAQRAGLTLASQPADNKTTNLTLDKTSFSSSQSSHAPALSSPRFGNLTSRLSPTTKVIYKYIAPIWRNRGIELLAVDLVAWAGIRTTLDLYREFLFKKTTDGKREFNWPAARERFLMEVMGSAPDGIGLLAFMAGRAMKNPFSNQFTDMDTLHYFQNLVKLPGIKSSKDFVQRLAQDLSKTDSHKVLPLIQGALSKKGSVDAAATQLAKLLKQTHTDRLIEGSPVAMETLLADAKALLAHTPKAASNGLWKKSAQDLLQHTLKVNHLRIPAGLALGILFNFYAPYVIQGVTRKLEGINDYPGERGLRELHHVDKLHDQKRGLLPYLRESLRKGNIIPTLISLAPLPIIAGMIDTEKLSVGSLASSINNPLKKGYWGRVMKMMQYGRSFPFAGAQQMAMLYALVVFSRVASARNGVEFRERTVDAFLGWSIWILLTPRVKKMLSQWFDKREGTQLMKMVAGEASKKSELEIARLIPNKLIRNRTLTRYAHINVAAILSTIVLLGIVEPYFSIKLTEWQSKWLSKPRQKAE